MSEYWSAIQHWFAIQCNLSRNTHYEETGSSPVIFGCCWGLHQSECTKCKKISSRVWAKNPSTGIECPSWHTSYKTISHPSITRLSSSLAITFWFTLERRREILRELFSSNLGRSIFCEKAKLTTQIYILRTRKSVCILNCDQLGYNKFEICCVYSVWTNPTVNRNL